MKDTAFRWSISLLCLAFFSSGAASAAVLGPGEAVATCFSDNSPNGPVVATFKVSDPVGTAPAPSANPQPWLGTAGAHWTRAQLGNNEFFGIALDDAPNPSVYLTSTAIYSSNYVGVIQQQPGTGEVWRIDGTTGAPSLCATLPQSTPTGGQGLGNIAYEGQHQLLFVSNFYDGKIHRITSSCQYLDAYDPFQQFGAYANTPAGFAPLGERLWGVGVFRGRLYFSRWSEDLSGGTANKIYSVPLDPTGKPVGAPSEILTVPGDMPVADIEFAADGRMLLAQRSIGGPLHGGEVYSWAHASDLLEYQEVNGNWVPSGHTFQLGDQGLPRSSAGGADYVCPAERTPGGFVIGTGDALIFSSSYLVYGFQMMPQSGGDAKNSYLVDLNDDFMGAESFDKTQIGDIDVYNTCDRKCSEFLIKSVICETDANGNATGKFIVQFQVKNLFKEAVYHAFLVDLPPGVTASKSYFPVAFGVDGDLDPGEVSQVLTTTLSGATPGQPLTFRITVHNQDLVECCATWVTINLPKCDCAQVLAKGSPSCNFFPWPSSTYSYSFKLQSLFTQASPAFLLIVPEAPSTATISPTLIPFTGNPQQLNLKIGNVAPGKRVCFLVSLHNSDFDRCCSLRQCVTLPRWFDFVDDPLPIGNTTVLFGPEGLSFSDPGLAPGIRIPLASGTKAFDLAWPEAEVSALPVGGRLEQSVEGDVDGSGVETVAKLVTERKADRVELSASFPGLRSTTSRFEFYRDKELVGMQEGVGVDAPAICNCGPHITTDAHFSILRWPGTEASQENPQSCDGTGPNCVFAGFTFKDASVFHLSGAAISFEADEVRVVPEDGQASVQSFTTAEIRVSGLPSLTLTDFRTERDCNDNGIPDYDDLTLLGALDFNLDGIPDECEAVDLSLNLATGFDDVAGTPSQPRAEDDDWKLVEPGPEHPAVVIAAPNLAWPSPLEGSLWVGAEAETGKSIAGTSTYLYERCFCLAASTSEVELVLAVQADDVAQVRLNGQPISDFGGHFGGAPLVVQKSGTPGDGLFVAGENCLAVEVVDFGGVVTGLSANGRLDAKGGICSP